MDGGPSGKEDIFMKLSMYLNYTLRALLRGGQRTQLAVFCVTVGVMAIVALQLVGSMLQSSLSANTRTTNGGDIAITAQHAPFKASDLSYFEQLKAASSQLWSSRSASFPSRNGSHSRTWRSYSQVSWPPGCSSWSCHSSVCCSQLSLCLGWQWC